LDSTPLAVLWSVAEKLNFPMMLYFYFQKEEKKEEAEDSDEDMGFGLFD